jgi:uncharacterized membrane protein
MDKMKQSVFLISVVLSLALMHANVSALGLEYYGVETSIMEDLSVNNVVVLEFDTPVNHLDYSLDFKIQNLKYEADFDFADCSLKDNDGGSTISCDFIGMTSEKNQLTLDFDTQDVIKKVGEDYRFTVNYGVPLPIQSSFILIRLPQNHILASEGNQSFFPTNGSIISDGRHIMVFWEDENLTTGENLQFSILFTRPAVVTEGLADLIIYLGAIILIVIILVSFIYIRRSRGSKVAVVKSVLNKDEKKIIDILNERQGRAGQKLLVRETDFSKAKVSRIVKALRERGVVDTEPISGRENRVILRLGQEKPAPRE